MEVLSECYFTLFHSFLHAVIEFTTVLDIVVGPRCLFFNIFHVLQKTFCSVLTQCVITASLTPISLMIMNTDIS